jgi:hypothetical protein
MVCFELQALGVGADQGYAVAVALGVALADDDVSVGVDLCCVHVGFLLLLALHSAAPYGLV